MSTSHRRAALGASALIGLFVLSACTAGPGGSPVPTSTSAPSGRSIEDAHIAPPAGRVVATGTVLDVDGDAQLCLGAVAESYPPQCTGIPLDGWTWDGVDGSETSGTTTWGAYAVTGEYDGERYAVTDPPMLLALYDPIRPEDPTGGEEGASTDAELTAIQDNLSTRLGADILSMWPERGYLWVQVTWDDGTLQAAADEEFSEGVVIVTSAIREID